jgi:(3S)-malyl-CoA thioesterase
MPETRPFRSVLYIPGSKDRALDKARALDADAIIFDLEDAVAPAEKARARETLAAALTQGGYGRRGRIVRINGLDTEWGRGDLAALRGLPLDGVLLPKVGRAADLAPVAAALPGVPLWAMMESPAAVLNAAEIAAAPGMAGLVMGTNDLLKDMGARFRPDRLGLMLALQTCLAAARANGLTCVDGVYNAFRDAEGLRAECLQGRDLGFDGKTLIHPDQLAIANEVFAPGEEEVALARRQIEAFEAAMARGEGVAVVDGRIVENLHIVTARALIDKAAMIAGEN